MLLFLNELLGFLFCVFRYIFFILVYFDSILEWYNFVFFLYFVIIFLIGKFGYISFLYFYILFVKIDICLDRCL